MSVLLNPFSFGGAASAMAVSRTHVQTITTNTNSYNFSSIAVGGAANANRKVLVFVALYKSDNSVSISSQTPSGATLLASFNVTTLPANRYYRAYLYSVPTGSTFGVTIAASASSDNCTVAAFTITGSSATGFADTASDAAGSFDTSVTVPIDIPGGGFAVGFLALLSTSAVDRTWTWENAVADADYNPSEGEVTTAIRGPVGSAEVGTEITLSSSSIMGLQTLILASIGPS